MAFEFLAPDQAHFAEEGGPLLRSPMEHLMVDAGASFEVRDGWKVATSYGSPEAGLAALRETVGWADCCRLGKLEVQASAGDLAGVLAAAGGPALELGRGERAADAWWCPVTAERALVLTEPAGTAAQRKRLEGARASGLVSVVEVTTGYGAVAVAGPQARELFGRLSALDLRPSVAGEQAFLPGSVARVPGLVLRTAEDAFLLLFGAAHGQYVWTVVADAGTELGGRPVGSEAFEGMESGTAEAARA